MDIDVLAEEWRRRDAVRRAERLERAARARRFAREAAAMLRADFGVSEVWLFGSLASEPRHDGFDVDLAVRGLRPAEYYTALARVWDIVGAAADLVPLESCSERARRAVAATGVRIDSG